MEDWKGEAASIMAHWRRVAGPEWNGGMSGDVWVRRSGWSKHVKAAAFDFFLLNTRLIQKFIQNIITCSLFYEYIFFKINLNLTIFA